MAATELEEMQFEILPDETSEEGGMVFGIGAEVSVDAEGFQPGTGEWLTQDASNPINGATAFGRDVLGGPTWAWDLHVSRDDVEGALESLERLKGLWGGREEVSSTPGAVQALRYRVGGRTRRVFGRPRRLQESPTNLILGGYIALGAEFQLVTSKTYGDQPQVFEVGAPVGEGSGMTFPVTFPIELDPPTPNETQLVVQGTAPASPIIELKGPMVNPSIITNDWRIDTQIALGPTQTMVIDTRPWHLSVMIDGAPVGGALKRGQRLNGLTLKPGRHSLALQSTGLVAGGSCRVRWFPTYYSI